MNVCQGPFPRCDIATAGLVGYCCLSVACWSFIIITVGKANSTQLRNNSSLSYDCRYSTPSKLNLTRSEVAVVETGQEEIIVINQCSEETSSYLQLLASSYFYRFKLKQLTSLFCTSTQPLIVSLLGYQMYSRRVIRLLHNAGQCWLLIHSFIFPKMFF